MTNKALISTLTWRSLEMQKAAFPDMPHFVAPHEIDMLLRPTRRTEKLVVHVMSLGVVADCLNGFLSFMEKLPKECEVRSKEEGFIIGKKTPTNKAVVLWRSARKFGAAKVGGRVSAEARKSKSKEGADRISDRWPQPSVDWPTSVLLKEAGLSYNTAISILGRRPIAQANHEAARKRKERRNASRL